MWNKMNKFTGWVDVPLSEGGLHEAMQVAENLRKVKIDVAFTSHLERAHQTLLTTLSLQEATGVFLHESEHAEMNYEAELTDGEIPIYTTWLLNERHYGSLQGTRKDLAEQKYGHDQVLEWRRGYSVRPPEGESLKDVYERAMPYFTERILPEVLKDQNVLVVAHGNTLRAIIKDLDGISDDKISELEISPAVSFIYTVKDGKLEKEFSQYTFNREIQWKYDR